MNETCYFLGSRIWDSQPRSPVLAQYETLNLQRQWCLMHAQVQDTVPDDPIPTTVPADQEQGPVPSPSTAPAATRDWYPVTKLLATKVVQKQRYFKVLWEDTNHPPTWEKEEDVSDALKA